MKNDTRGYVFKLYHQALTDRDPNMRRIAIAELGDMARKERDPEALERLQRLSTFYDAPDDTRGGAFRELTLIDEKNALEQAHKERSQRSGKHRLFRRRQ